MRLFLLLFTSLGVHAEHWGVVQDTPEVAHAKAQHFVAVAKAKAHILNSASWYQGISNPWSIPHYAPQVKYHGPVALPPGYDKHGAPLAVLDTPEVAHAKSLHLAAIAKAGGDIHPATGPDLYWSHAGQSDDWPTAQHYAPSIKYHGPYAYSPGFDKHGAPLPVLETPEVSHAKHLHFAAHAEAAAANAANGHAHHGHHKWKRSLHEAHVEAAKLAHYAAVEKAKAEIASAVHHQTQHMHNAWAFPHYAPAVKYHGPIALPPGYDKHGAPLPVHDTPEVAHAKAAHLAEVAKAGGYIHPAGPEHPSFTSGYESSWALPYYAPHIKYYGPIALPPGYDKHGAPLPVLDTPEVAAAKAEHFYLYAKTLERQHSPILMYGHWK